MSDVRYKIYPSLLDKFQVFLDSDIEAEAFWNIDSETGEMKRTPDEIASQHEKELLDSINRVPHEPIEAADMGTCFNEILDCLIENRKPLREDLTVESLPDPYLVCQNFCNARDCDFCLGKHGESCTAAYDRARSGKCDAKAIRATLNGFTFDFDVTLCREAAASLDGALPQHLCKGYIETKYGTVELYGYSDYIQLDKVIDVKTTSSYSFGKFERAWQKEVYPYCLVQSGEMGCVSEFEYKVFQLSKPSSRNPVITAKMYKEPYTFDFSATEKRLSMFLERFIEWLESHKADITDKKIFNYVLD